MFLVDVSDNAIYIVLISVLVICFVVVISLIVKVTKKKKHAKETVKPVENVKVQKEETVKPIVVKEANEVKAEVNLATREKVDVEKRVNDKKEDIKNPVEKNEEEVVSNQVVTDEQKTSERKYVGKYEIFKEGEYFKYRLKASNGEVLCVSEIYSSEKGCFDAIENVKKNLNVGTITIGSDKNGLYTFTLKAKNGRPLIVSANYSTKDRVESAMNSFKRFANTSIVNVIDEVKESAFLNEMEKVEPQSVDNEYNGKFVVSEKDDKYSYVLKASNGVVLLRSDEYNSKVSCLNAIQVLKNAIEKGTFYLAQDKRNQFQFKLFSDKNRLIVVGESYARKASALSAVNSVRKFYLNAKIVEEEKVEPVLEK